MRRPRPVLRPYLAAIGLNDRARNRQAETGALWLGRIERLEDALELVIRDAGARIRNRHLDLGLADKCALDRYFARACSATLHGIHPIQYQVQNDLLDLHLIGAHRQGDLRLIDAQFNASLRRFRDENIECGPNCVIQVEVLELDLGSFLKQPTQIAG